MGVTGLWTVVQPCARPVKIETLNRKRLAVDASIWIYQFLKAVRDKEGNALRNSHVVGFFRRICKLLFFGIKPVFVFDGGAPALKRQTIMGRKQRREGRRDDAVRTAGKLLALQMQRRAEEDEEKRRLEAEHPRQQEEEEPLPENLVYVEELHMTQKERQQSRKFKKKDAYHLPDLDVSLTEMGGPNDPRVMSLEELQEYARQFQQGEDINVYDFSKIDFDSPFFMSLPASDRYNILNAARLRSRLRMGYSKDQLNTMFPDRMAFSKFQVDRVRERNELTQRLMNINGMVDDTMLGGGRVAGEKGKEYILVRNEGVEGGWALGVVSDKDGGKEEKPIDVDELDKPNRNPEAESSDDEFEDIPVEGLNRLPRRLAPNVSDATEQRARKAQNRAHDSTIEKQRHDGRDGYDSLFVPDAAAEVEDGGRNDLFNEQDSDLGDAATEQEKLDKAIAMSLEQEDASEEDDFAEVFQQKKAEEPVPFTRGSGRSLARMANNRSRRAAPINTAFDKSESEGEDEDITLQIALAQSRNFEEPVVAPRISSMVERNTEPQIFQKMSSSSKPSVSSGPLPFEALDLGSSLLGKKKMQKLTEENEGGFDKLGEERKEDSVRPLPAWFSTTLEQDISAQKSFDELQLQPDYDQFEPAIHKEDVPGTRETNAIDVDAKETKNQAVIQVDSDEDGDGDGDRDGDEAEVQAVKDMEQATGDSVEPKVDDPLASSDVIVEDPELRMGDLADMTKAEPPRPRSPVRRVNQTAPESPEQISIQAEHQSNQATIQAEEPSEVEQTDQKDHEDFFEWDASDEEHANASDPQEIVGDTIVRREPLRMEVSRSPSVEFEDVGISVGPSADDASRPARLSPSEIREDVESGPIPASGTVDQEAVEAIEQDAELYSDPEDEDLLQQLAAEAEEHARFASSLNDSGKHLSVEEYERELRQLRNQQKKDRRDADEVTQVMITECQQLLRLFGLPYITAPMEAEAQCAEMVSLGLVDGIVTDDSDIFLFGGTRIYKNMFNQAKFVECYLSSDLEKEFDLDRQKLIGIAHLLGSDYTDGLPGVGPVTALEIISEFPSLQDFKEWWSGVQSALIPKSADSSSAFRKKFRRQANKLFLQPAFPDIRVDHAYLEPEVDSDPQPFEWGVPDLNALRSFLMATIGWSEERTDEVLVPVIKDMNRRQDEGTQANITSFFQGGTGVGGFAPRVREGMKSKRMEGALGRMAEQARKRRKGGSEVIGTAGETDEEDTEAAVIEELHQTNITTKGSKKRPEPATAGSEDDEYDEAPKRSRQGTSRRSKRAKGR
ncbi:MAG: DNA repair protein rad2 [Bogoriella megaspora]|nr:MAG: DNA repair protein rad2 [Bogoriella megaspora]